LARHCEICGKIGVVGSNISHAHNVSKRKFEPNLQRVRAQVEGGNKRIWVCTRCIRSGKIQKASGAHA
jgi:large subunit ribosomal protein L28